MGRPFEGRDRELGQLAGVLARPSLGCAVIRGPMGIGKTRLLSEFAAQSTSAGWGVERISGALSVAEIPFGALAHLLPVVPSEVVDPLQFLVKVRTDLLARYGRRSLLVTVDDAHLLDDASALCLSQMVVAGGCAVVFASRVEESLPESVAALVKDELAAVVDVGPLDEPAVEAILSELLDGEVDPPTRAEVVRVAQGNPLFLRELANEAQQARLGHSKIVEIGSSLLTVSENLQKLVTRRIGDLPVEAIAGLEALAYAEPLEASLLSLFLTDAVAADLERQGVIASQYVKRRRVSGFSHPLFAEVIRASTPIGRGRVIAGKLAKAVDAAGGRRRDDLMRLAVWHLESGSPIEVNRLLSAAHLTASAADYQLAERLAQAAIKAGGGPYAIVALADAVSKQNRRKEAEEILNQIDLDSADEQLFTAVLLTRVMNLRAHHEDFVKGIRLLDEGRAKVADVACRARIDSVLSYFQVLQPDPPAALAATQRILSEPDAPEEAKLDALTVTSLATLWMCKFDDTEAYVAQGLELATTVQGEVPSATEKLLINRHNAQTYNGQVTEAERGLRIAYQQAVSPPVHPMAGAMACWLGQALAVQGKLREALIFGGQAVSLLESFDQFWIGLTQSLSIHAAVAGRAGDKHTLDIALDKLAAQPPMRPPLSSLVARARAWQCALDGDTQQAALMALEAGETDVGANVPLPAAWSFYDSVLFGHPGIAVQRLQEIAAASSSPTLYDFAVHAAALQAGNAHGLEAVGASFAAREELLFAFHAYTQAARIHRTGGNQQSAARATIKTELLLEQFTGPPPWGYGAQPRYLTPRETETARLAATGLSSREIADRLHIGVRTVDNHLAATYIKLGVHSRDALSDVFAPPSRTESSLS